MSVSIVVGGQFGSEGKGKVVRYACRKLSAKYCARVGGPNAGHTVYKDGKKYIFRCLPVGIIESGVKVVLSAGSYIDLDILHHEMKLMNVGFDRVLIDDKATIIKRVYAVNETDAGLRDTIGSTLSGTGAAVIERMRGNAILARDIPWLQTCDTVKIMREALICGDNIVIEGTQGYGLSVLHGKDWPYATSRDTTASAVLFECGLSPFDVEYVILVLRTFPIRVSGNSGRLPREMTWEDVRRISGDVDDMTEYTSCTNRVRRVAEFDDEVVIGAIRANNPNIIVMNHMDYVDCSVRDGDVLSQKCIDFLNNVEERIGRRINLVGTGVNTFIER